MKQKDKNFSRPESIRHWSSCVVILFKSNLFLVFVNIIETVIKTNSQIKENSRISYMTIRKMNWKHRSEQFASLFGNVSVDTVGIWTNNYLKIIDVWDDFPHNPHRSSLLLLHMSTIISWICLSSCQVCKRKLCVFNRSQSNLFANYYDIRALIIFLLAYVLIINW